MIETKFHLGDRVKLILPTHSTAANTLAEEGLSEEIAAVIRCIKTNAERILYGIQFDNPHDFLHNCTMHAAARNYLFGETGRQCCCWWISEDDIELAEGPIDLNDLI